jgi:hypothetical protein
MTFLKSVGHTLKTGSSSVSHLVTQPYKDVRSAVSYSGKHIIGDVDKVTNTATNPIFLYGGMAIVLLMLLKK